MKEFVGSKDEENVSSAPSCKIGGLDVPPVGLASEITVEKEKRVHRLVPAEPVKGVPAKPPRPTESSGEGRELLQLKSDNILDRKSTRLNSSHVEISYAVFCLK